MVVAAGRMLSWQESQLMLLALVSEKGGRGLCHAALLAHIPNTLTAASYRCPFALPEVFTDTEGCWSLKHP